MDEEQLAWLRAALDRANGKVVLAMLGHPPLAGGLDQTRDNEPFAAINRLLREHHVHVVMAGDTHDLEYYRQPVTDDGRPGAVHYFVNGGGGAYQSFGTALAWPARPPTASLGVLSDPRRRRQQDRSMDAALEASGMVVDQERRRLALFGRMVVRRVRLQRRTLLPELHRGPCRTGGGKTQAPALGRARTAAMV